MNKTETIDCKTRRNLLRKVTRAQRHNHLFSIPRKTPPSLPACLTKLTLRRHRPGHSSKATAPHDFKDGNVRLELLCEPAAQLHRQKRIHSVRMERLRGVNVPGRYPHGFSSLPRPPGAAPLPRFGGRGRARERGGIVDGAI